MHADQHSNRSSTPRHRGIVRAGVLALAAFMVLIVGAGPASAASRTGASWAPHLDRKILPTRAEAHGSQLATWYGPGLFGNGTACGQTLTPDTWGIAHRTLRCGTLVTLVHHGRRVSVRVVDRGPFSGADIDLTSRTKSYLRFQSGTVRMTEIHRFRLVPKPNRRVVGTFASPT